LDTASEVFEALASEAPFLNGLTYEEIGGTGIRWQTRHAASKAYEAAGAPSAGIPHEAPTGTRQTPGAPGGVAPDEGAPAPSNGHEVNLGTYRDLWSGEVTERNPALSFLTPAQTFELAPADAERLGLSHGQDVTVSSNGHSVEAKVAVRERMRPGAGFLIEGTARNNANLLAGAELVEVRPAGEAAE